MKWVKWWKETDIGLRGLLTIYGGGLLFLIVLTALDHFGVKVFP